MKLTEKLLSCITSEEGVYFVLYSPTFDFKILIKRIDTEKFAATLSRNNKKMFLKYVRTLSDIEELYEVLSGSKIDYTLCPECGSILTKRDYKEKYTLCLECKTKFNITWKNIS